MIHYNLPYPCPINAERLDDLAVAHALSEHSADVSAKLIFVGISQTVFRRLRNSDVEAVDA